MDKTIDENYSQLKCITEALNVDYEKFKCKKVKVAGARVRNNLLNCKKLCDVLRKQVLNDINKLPINHRIKKDVKDEGVFLNEKPADEVKEDEV